MSATRTSLMAALVDWATSVASNGRFGSRTSPDRLRELRNVCHSMLDDLDSEPGRDLSGRVELATQASEFWHLRPRLFDVVSEVHGQSVAAQRLAALDRLLQVNHDRRSQLSKRSTSTRPAVLIPAHVPVADKAPTPRRRASDKARL